jgi:hypothetical protein
MNINKYTTVNGTSEMELDLRVNEAIRQGFQPFGNPYTPEAGHFYQAMVKEKVAPAPPQRGKMCQLLPH